MVHVGTSVGWSAIWAPGPVMWGTLARSQDPLRTFWLFSVCNYKEKVQYIFTYQANCIPKTNKKNNSEVHAYYNKSIRGVLIFYYLEAEYVNSSIRTFLDEKFIKFVEYKER